jgi:hypothetical protein
MYLLCMYKVEISEPEMWMNAETVCHLTCLLGYQTCLRKFDSDLYNTGQKHKQESYFSCNFWAYTPLRPGTKWTLQAAMLCDYTATPDEDLKMETACLSKHRKPMSLHGNTTQK